MKNIRLSICTVLTVNLLLLFMTTGCKKEEDEPTANLPVITTAEVNTVLMNTAWSGGVIAGDGGSTVTARGVVWSRHDQPTLADSKTIDGSGAGSFLSHVTGLVPGATYYLRAYATNAGGTAYGSTMVFGAISDTFTDSRDGNVYHAIQIGDQIWMTENLRFLPEVTGPGTVSYYEPEYYVYGYMGTSVDEARSTEEYQTYGVLYNWPAAMASVPEGWHLPSDQEWKTLEMTLGMTQEEADGLMFRGANQGAALAGNKSLWFQDALTGDPAFGSSGFDALPAGGFYGITNEFSGRSEFAHIWCSDQGSQTVTYYRGVDYMTARVWRSDYGDKCNGFQVRCVRDLAMPK